MCRPKKAAEKFGGFVPNAKGTRKTRRKKVIIKPKRICDVCGGKTTSSFCPDCDRPGTLRDVTNKPEVEMNRISRGAVRR